MNRYLRSRSPILAVLAALALVLGQVAVFAHFAAGTHAGVSADGRELDYSGPAPAASVHAAAPAGPGFAAAGVDAFPGTHPCELASLLRERPGRAARVTVLACVSVPPSLSPVPVLQARTPGLSLILLAPKNSPPSA